MSFLGCDDNCLPDTAINDIKVFIEDNYRGARIVKMEREDNRTVEVDII